MAVSFTESSGSDWEQGHVDSIDTTTRQRKTLLTNAADARYSPTGHLVFMRGAVLLAVPFDGVSRDIDEAPVPLLAGVMHSIIAPNPNEETGMGHYAISASGTLLYASGGIYPVRTMTMCKWIAKVAKPGWRRSQAASCSGCAFLLMASGWLR
jgi:hypothetical protein